MLRQFYPDIGTAAASGRSANQLPANAEMVKVNVSSTPDGADIMVDRKFVGNTPSSLKLTSGPYKIIVKLSGYSDWERELTVMKDSQVAAAAEQILMITASALYMTPRAASTLASCVVNVGYGTKTKVKRSLPIRLNEAMVALLNYPLRRLP